MISIVNIEQGIMNDEVKNNSIFNIFCSIVIIPCA